VTAIATDICFVDANILNSIFGIVRACPLRPLATRRCSSAVSRGLERVRTKHVRERRKQKVA
jgi:hypothetical protein